MSQPQMLNLDALAPLRKSVTIGGKSYVIKGMTVEHFIEINQLADELEKKQNMTPAESVDATVRSVAMSLEGCDIAVIRGLSIEQLSVLARFIRGEYTPESIQAEAAAQADAQGNA